MSQYRSGYRNMLLTYSPKLSKNKSFQVIHVITFLYFNLLKVFELFLTLPLTLESFVSILLWTVLVRMLTNTSPPHTTITPPCTYTLVITNLFKVSEFFLHVTCSIGRFCFHFLLTLGMLAHKHSHLPTPQYPPYHLLHNIHIQHKHNLLSIPPTLRKSWSCSFTSPAALASWDSIFCKLLLSWFTSDDRWSIDNLKEGIF